METHSLTLMWVTKLQYRKKAKSSSWRSEYLTLNSHPVNFTSYQETLWKRWCTASKNMHQRTQIWTGVLEVPGTIDINCDRAVVELFPGGQSFLAGPLVSTPTSLMSVGWLKIKSKPYTTVCLSCSVSLSALFMSQLNWTKKDWEEWGICFLHSNLSKPIQELPKSSLSWLNESQVGNQFWKLTRSSVMIFDSFTGFLIHY